MKKKTFDNTAAVGLMVIGLLLCGLVWWLVTITARLF
jgi:hypothetical protein